MPAPHEDWLSVVRAIQDGDAVAFAKLARLITGFLGQARAFDFQPDWDDIVQEIATATLDRAGGGKFPDANALAAYVKVSVRNRVIDRIRRSERWDRKEVDADSADLRLPSAERATEELVDARGALERLPERQRQAVWSVYGEGRTYEEAAAATGIPLGSLKRYLRLGLAELLEALGG